jgi:hypothetical protein
MNVKSSSFGAIIALFSNWNMPIEPKIQIFNYIFFLVAFNIRWILKDKFFKEISLEWLGKIIFYSILTVIIYIRQDNIIIIGVALLWDFFHAKRKWIITLPLIIIPAIYYSLKLQLGNTFTDGRTLATFLGHFGINNQEIFSEYIKAKIPNQTILDIYFQYPTNLWEAFWARPFEFIAHVFKNLINISKISNTWSLSLESHWKFGSFLKLVFLFLALKIFSRGISPSKFNKLDFKEIKLFSTTILIKCLGVSLVFNWWLKYFFELSIVITIWVIIFTTYLRSKSNKELFEYIQKIIQKFKYIQSRICNFVHLRLNFVKSVPIFLNTNWVWLFIPTLLLFHNYQTTTLFRKTGISQFVEIVRKENSAKPIVNILSGSDFFSYPLLEPKLFHLYVNRKYDFEVKSNLNLFLTKYKIDTIILYDDYRTALKEVGMEKQFYDFENNYSDYGYELRFENDIGMKLYRRIRD